MSKLKIILNKLKSLEQQLTDGNFAFKKVLSFTEACDYLDLSKSFLYKLTSSGKIVFYKPEGKRIYFHRDDLDNWLLRNRSKSANDLDQLMDNYLIQQKRKNLNKRKKGGKS